MEILKNLYRMPFSKTHKNDFLVNVFYGDPWHFLAIAKKCQGKSDMLDSHCQYIGRLLLQLKSDIVCQSCKKAPATRFLFDWKTEKVLGGHCESCDDKKECSGFYPITFASLQSFTQGKNCYQRVARFLMKAFGFDKAVAPLRKMTYLPEPMLQEKKAVALAKHLGFSEAPAPRVKADDTERSIPSENLIASANRNKAGEETVLEEEYRLF